MPPKRTTGIDLEYEIQGQIKNLNVQWNTLYINYTFGDEEEKIQGIFSKVQEIFPDNDLRPFCGEITLKCPFIETGRLVDCLLYIDGRQVLFPTLDDFEQLIGKKVNAEIIPMYWNIIENYVDISFKLHKITS